MFKKRLAILDLECTCDEKRGKPDDYTLKVKREDMEIIEIGVVICDLFGNINEKFNVFVKPTINPILTDFCKELTSISQNNVDSGMDFKNAIQNLDQFIEKNNVDLWCSWGRFDYDKIKQEANRKNVNSESLILFQKRYIDLSVSYRDHYQLSHGRRCGMGRAMNRERIEFDGVRHRAINDVINVAKIIKSVNKEEICWDI